MFPIRDHNPSARTPYVVYGLLGLNVLIFLSYFPAGTQHDHMNTYVGWALFPAQISGGDGYIRLITSMFLHGGYMHLIGNILFLWIFGDNLEDCMGHVGFLIFYLFSGIGAGVAQVLADPGSTVPMVGASGAIAGIMGGYLLLYPKARVDVLLIFIIFFRVFSMPAWIMLGIWFALQAFNGVFAIQEGGGVAYWAHAGGFIVGLILIIPSWLRRGGKDFWQATDGRPPHPEKEYPRLNASVPSVKRRRR